MSDYIIGGWSQSTADIPPDTFSYTMYGMITNLEELRSGVPGSEFWWSPNSTTAPAVSGKVMWTYGGAGCTPFGMPKSDMNIDQIVDATNNNGWAGVDFDDECSMDVGQMINAMQQLRPKQSSYTFLAGWNYNNPGNSLEGEAINEAVRQIAQAQATDRYVLMCYADSMWSMADIEANVGPAIQRTMANGVPRNQVILALTPAGLNSENLNYFLDQVISNDIGGLFIWNYPSLEPEDLNTIVDRLGIKLASIR